MTSGPRSRVLGTSAKVVLIATVALALMAVVIAAEGTEAAPNLRVSSTDIVPAASQPTKDTTTTVDVTVRNTGDANATTFYVLLRDVTASKDVDKLGPYGLTPLSSRRITFTWNLAGVAGGTHTLRAIADVDDQVAESDETDNSADRAVTVNLPPVAKAASSVGFAYTGTPISFSASGSSDPDGVIRAYLWYFGDGKTGEGFNVSHTYLDGSSSPGKYLNVTLVVSDEDGGVGSTTITVRIYNRLPFAKALGATIYTMTPTSVSGTGSYDLDGQVVKFRWTLHNGTVMWGSSVVVKYRDDGSFGISLTVWDDDGESDTTSITMNVLNQEPYVVLKANRTLVGKGDLIRFDASGSEDVDGVITNFTWIFGDHTTAFTPVVDHAYEQNGSYNVTLVTVDDDGAMAHATVRVIVGNSPPMAVARASEGYVLTYEDILFNASFSSDIDRNIASYSWDFGDGFSAMGKVVEHNFTDDGTYDVTLTVTDTGGAFGTDVVTVVVANRAPVAAFGNLTVKTNEAAFLDGGDCWDMDGYIASFLWDLGSGQVYSTPNATHTWSSPGVHEVLLTIWDDDGASDSTTFTVTVQNRMPVAVIIANPLKTTLARPVSFNGSASRDTDGPITNWTWSFGDGVKAYGTVVSHTYSAYGTYLATLTVRDNYGGVNTTSVLITVRNQPPLAIMNVTPLVAMTGEVVTFNGSGSSDPENQIADYFWSFGDGDSATGAVITHIYSDDSIYTVRLTVVDMDATASFVETRVKVLNRPPVAKAEATPSSALTLEDMTFKGTASSDPDGRVLWFHWHFGDGTEGYGPTVVHAFSDDGTYTVTLTVTDDDGLEATHSVEVEVINRAPVSIAGEEQSTRTGIPIRLDGRQSYDLDGRIVTYRWDFGDGTSATGSVVNHAFPDYGTYVVMLTVTDDDGASSVGNLTVTVYNVHPVARFSGNTRILSGETLELDGTSSYDLDGTIVDLKWDMGDGLTEVGLIIQHPYTSVGVYTVTLTVEDDGGLTSSYQMTIEVLNRRPNASISASRTALPTGDPLELDGSGSADPDGRVDTYTWIFGDGSVAYGASVTHFYGDDGIFMVVLTVTDDAGGTDSTALFIQVENRPPMPAIAGPEDVLTLLVVEFTAEGSLDPDGGIKGYFWDFGDGNGAKGWNVTHQYATAGSYIVRLTVMDDDGRTAYTNVTIEVVNRPPYADVDAPAEVKQNSTVKFDATACYDPDGLVSEWLWDFGDETTGSGRETYHRYVAAGTYTWTLTVVDDSGDTQEVSGSIYVEEIPLEPEKPDVPDGGGEDESPGPGALAAVLALTLSVAALEHRRRRLQA